MSDPGATRRLVLVAMIFAVAMTFIDQTIVSIAAPKIQTELGLSGTGIQWAVNAYLLALAAFFAFGGRLADTIGHRPMVIIGIIVFAGSSALCGLTPKGGAAEAWIVTFRAVQGLGGALMYPAALAIVVNTYAAAERGRALALFFGIAGGLTAVGPALGGYLTEWTWRSIFWINVPVAAVALVLTARANPPSVRRPARLDLRGLALITTGVGLSVFGLQQSKPWGWSNPVTGLCIGAGLLLVIAFLRVERHTEQPLMDVSIFRDRVFFMENVILGIATIVFVPVFFFASEYAQVSLGKTASQASVVLLYFFAGFVLAAQLGGRALDRVGAKRPILIGTALATTGLALWASHVTTLSLSGQIAFIVMSGAGIGMMLGQANTDAINQVGETSYGEATGITQTVRNYGAALGFAVMGTVLLTVFSSKLTDGLVAQGVPRSVAAHESGSISQLSGPHESTSAIPHFVRVAFADATSTVLYSMAGVMGLAFVVALFGLRRGRSAAVEPAAATT